jgi:hypothetical protein
VQGQVGEDNYTRYIWFSSPATVRRKPWPEGKLQGVAKCQQGTWLNGNKLPMCCGTAVLSCFTGVAACSRVRRCHE